MYKVNVRTCVCPGAPWAHSGCLLSSVCLLFLSTQNLHFVKCHYLHLQIQLISKMLLQRVLHFTCIPGSGNAVVLSWCSDVTDSSTFPSHVTEKCLCYLERFLTLFLSDPKFTIGNGAHFQGSCVYWVKSFALASSSQQRLRKHKEHHGNNLFGKWAASPASFSRNSGLLIQTLAVCFKRLSCISPSYCCDLCTKGWLLGWFIGPWKKDVRQTAGKESQPLSSALASITLGSSSP